PVRTNSRAARRAATIVFGRENEKSKKKRKRRRAAGGSGAAAGSVLSARSIASKPTIAWGRPSSSTVKSAAVSPRTGCPSRPSTGTGTSRSDTSADWRTGAGSCAAAAAERRPARRTHGEEGRALIGGRAEAHYARLGSERAFGFRGACAAESGNSATPLAD